jgi:hypothetical protein
MKTIYRNGDWHFIPTTEKHEENVTHKGSFIFATGEATNHHHVAIVAKPEDMIFTKMPDGSYLVTFHSTARITHPEHSMIQDLFVPAGTYKLLQRREQDWFSLTVRKIID